MPRSTRAIREHRFAYGPSAGLRQIRQPPDALDLTRGLEAEFADLFQPGVSPRAREAPGPGPAD